VIGILDVVRLVVDALEHAAVRYSVGGSLASSVFGEPRSSLDADIVVDMTTDQIAAVIDTLGDSFYAEEEAFRRAVASATSANVIHLASGIKVDLFVASSVLDRQQLARRRLVSIDREHSCYMHSPEDILLQKLVWYRRGGETSDRQWRDVLGILLVRETALDETYLNAMAEQLKITDLLVRARQATSHT
jgi:hypothetical protein